MVVGKLDAVSRVLSARGLEISLAY